jgi:NADH-quinone oxidoreductase subunit M
MDALLLSIVVPFAIGSSLLLGLWRSERVTRILGFLGFVVPAMCALAFAFIFASGDVDATGFVMGGTYRVGLEFFGIALSLGLNGISMPLYLLAGIVGFAAGIQALSSPADRKGLYVALLLIMLSGLMGAFATTDIFFSYLFHEFALIPTFIMIGLWGGQGRRAVALEMTIYLTVGAMITLVGLLALYMLSGCERFTFSAMREWLSVMPLSDHLQNVLAPVLLIGLGILVSLWPFHAWAPRAYAAAPTATAMLHAGVLKKFGLYIIIQLIVFVVDEGVLASVKWLVALALIGNVLIMGMVTIAQRDLKMMIGSSSVMHMGYAFLGIATMTTLGLGGAILLMFAHGLSVALSFMLATAIYQRTDTYDMSEMGGLVARAPVLAAFFVGATLASIGLPGFANFWGELSIFIALWQMSPWVCALAIVGIVISAVYGLRAVSSIFFGDKHSFSDARDLNWTERVPGIILFAALLVVGFFPNTITQMVDAAFSANLKEGWRVVAPNQSIEEDYSFIERDTSDPLDNL